MIVPDGLQHGEGCVIGDRAVVGAGCILGHRVRIDPNATVLSPTSFGSGSSTGLLIHDDVVIGAAAVVSGASVIGTGSRIEPGTVVTQDVPAHAIVAGNPAQLVGYVSPPGIESTAQPVGDVPPPNSVGIVQLIGGASLIRFPELADLRGKLSFGEVGGLLPFEVRRFFFVYGVPTQSIRGEHAHRRIHQLLICASGTLRVSLTDGTRRREVVLEEPSVGLHLPPMIWATQYRHGPSTCLLTLCSEEYDPEEYIREFDRFLQLSR